ncbi:hypothetical protein Tco_0382457 [Tanacetum coccineum]
MDYSSSRPSTNGYVYSTLIKSSEDKDSLGDHEDASKQGRSIEDIDKDADVSLVDDTQGRSDNEEMFDTNEPHSGERLFDNEMRRVNTFIPMDYKEVKGKKETEESFKGTEDELKSDKSKKEESSEEKAKCSRKNMLGKKRAEKEQQEESSKKQRMEEVKENDGA